MSKVSNIDDARKKRKPPTAEWAAGLILTKEGCAKANVANVLHVFARHPTWTDVLAYDAFSETIVKLRPPPVRDQDAPAAAAAGDWTEADSVRTAAWFSTVACFDPAITLVDAAVTATAERNVMHPVRDWLAALEWDCCDRAERLFVDYFGAPDTSYVRAIGVRFLIGAVARVSEPGCQNDCMPVLEGEQGIKKSTGLEALFSKPWFSDSAVDVGSKDSYQALRRKWCHEFSELDAFKGREVTRVKSFISARVDNYRPSYGRRNRDFPRQIVFVGSTNESEYLADRTGNRRFWPIKCTAVDVEGIRRDREQLWAEARVRYDRGERWYLDTPELRRLAEGEQSDRVAADVWLELVARWLEAPTVPDGDGTRLVLNIDDGIRTSDVLLGALQFDASRVNRAAESRAGQVLRSLGFDPRQARAGSDWTRRERRYFRHNAEQVVTQDVTDVVTTESAEKQAYTQASHTSQRKARTHTRDEPQDDRRRFTENGCDGCEVVTDEPDERLAIQSEGES